MHETKTRPFSILIPHYKTGRMTAYCIHQINKNRGDHPVNIFIVNNSGPEGLDEVMAECAHWDNTAIIEYPTAERMQTHGLAFEYVMENLYDRITDYFITMETDSFPIDPGWLDQYARWIADGYDFAGSLLKLSVGQYVHPAGAMYAKRWWRMCKDYVLRLADMYEYFPNMLIKDDFPCHIMKRRGEQVNIRSTDIHHSYREGDYAAHAERYRPIADSVFHNGMGRLQESYYTYGQRNVTTGSEDLAPGETWPPLIYRMGYEPGQFFSYWLISRGVKTYFIPTEVVWMPNRENQQQEYTLTLNGVKHLWGVTAYGTSDTESVADITARKNQIMNELFESIDHGSPQHMTDV